MGNILQYKTSHMMKYEELDNTFCNFKMNMDESHVMPSDSSISVIDNVVGFALTRTKSHPIEARLIN